MHNPWQLLPSPGHGSSWGTWELYSPFPSTHFSPQPPLYVLPGHVPFACCPSPSCSQFLAF